MDKLWGSGAELNRAVELYTAGEDYKLDSKLLKYDCMATMVHAEMLEQQDILLPDELSEIKLALAELPELHREGKFNIDPEDEDCHTAIEKHLVKKLGDTGKKIHSLRSRNDQVLTALRLFMKDEVESIKKSVLSVIDSITGFSDEYGHIKIPGYTHTRKAMPSTVAMWSEAYRDSMIDNLTFIKSVNQILDQSPLGTGAGYGVPADVNREYTAEKLGFARVQENPVYTQNSRHKFEGMLLMALSQIMLDLNRLASDLIFLSVPEIDLFRLPAGFCTGSSIMPQKSNPDVLELLRGNYHQVAECENLVRALGVNLISGYHRDMQISKGYLMKGLKITSDSLEIGALLFYNLTVIEESAARSMTKELYAAEDALKLVKEGVPFRDAYLIIKKEYEGAVFERYPSEPR